VYERIIRGVMKKVLIAEGDETLRRIIEITLMNEDLTVLFAANGQQVMEMARSEVPDLIVAETRLSMMSGTELKNNLSNFEDTAHIPVILLSAGYEEGVESGEGASEISRGSLIKPFSPMRLLAHMYLALRKSNNEPGMPDSFNIDLEESGSGRDFTSHHPGSDDPGDVGPEHDAAGEAMPGSDDAENNDE